MVKVVGWKEPVLFPFLAPEKVLAFVLAFSCLKKKCTGSIKRKSGTLEHSSVITSPQSYR